MSRSHSNKRKRPGYDYWSKRYGNSSMCNSPGPHVKDITVRAERRIAKQELHMEERGGCGQPEHVGAVPSPEGTHYCETCRALAAERQVAEQAAEIERLTKILDSGALVWDDNCGGYHHDIADIHPNLDPGPLWVIDLSSDARNWRDELEKGGEA